jgi:CheY-like chemotaxis protein
VLLVEDEEQLRAVAREILESLGYLVLEARHPEEALRVADTHEGPIHLLLTDIVMPGTSGRALAETLLAARPHLRVVYMSGWSQGGLEPAALFLQKPFNAEALARKIRMALDGPTVTDA